jgi:predicted metalloprotease
VLRSPRARSSAATAATILGTLSVLGCTAVTPDAVSERAVRLSESATVEPDDLASAAVADLEAWWGEEFPTVHGGEWTPVADVVAATPDLDEVPSCGAPITYPDVVEFGAFYCPATDTIVYDGGGTGFLADLTATVGPATVPVVLAHEYGHAVQSRAGDLDRGLAVVFGEQQADCYAGAWMQRVTSGGSELVRFTDADLRAALVAMIAVRDPIGTDPLLGNGHGAAFDRIGAFQEGYRNGAARCAELLDDPLPLVPNEFLSTTDAINDGDLPFGFDDGAIGPLVVETLNSYWSFELGDQFSPITLVPTDDATAADACSAEPVTVVAGVVWCAADASVVVDIAVAQQVYEDPIEGRADFAVGYLIAVGWAEAIQSLLGSTATGEARALASDCLAGAYALDMLPRPPRPDEGDGLGAASPGDLDEAALAAIQLGDATAADDVVGSPIEKTTRFRTGVLGGFDACRPLLDD